MGSRLDLSAQAIQERLAEASRAHERPPYPEYPYMADLFQVAPRPAAVLIPLCCDRGSWQVLLTRRHAGLPEHSGQVAFPGGRTDPEDLTPVMTALREAWEETGIQAEHVTVLGELPKFLTITNYLVTPVVGEIPWPYPVQPAADEVSRVFTIPLDWLADPHNHEERLRALPEPYEPISVIYFKEYDGEVLWGASARFTLTLLDILSQ